MRSDAVPLKRGSLPDDRRNRFLVPGTAEGDVVFTDVPLSFMMGVHAETGAVMDEHHPLVGTPLQGKVVVMPQGRGSCSGSGVIVELLHRGTAPAALVFRHPEEILMLGALVADAMFGKSLPVVVVEDDGVWAQLATADRVAIDKDALVISGSRQTTTTTTTRVPLARPYVQSVATTAEDDRVLRGEGCSRAAQLAMELIVEAASIQGAQGLVSVSQVHIDACCYVGPTSLLVPERLRALGGRVVVPTTCNSLNVDRRRWRELGADAALSTVGCQIGDAYLAMGATMSFTCAPYLLDSRPAQDDQIGWGESNAVVYANSALGACTQKYPDYLDLLIALTGRAPAVGCHLPEGRRPQMRVVVPPLRPGFDDALFPLLGYHIGAIVGGRIPMIVGLENTNPGVPDLKAFGAGFATTSSAPMFHMAGVTPEAATVEQPAGLEKHVIAMADLVVTWQHLNTASRGKPDRSVDLVSLGNPHFALEEFRQLAGLVAGRGPKHADVDVIITTSRFVHDQAAAAGYLAAVERFGAQCLTDTCWCMLEEPVIRPSTRTIMTNSAKYAHYGPGVVKRRYHFGGLAGCVEAAIRGERSIEDLEPAWLFGGE